MEYRSVTAAELTDHFLDGYVRTQQVEQCLRRVNGRLTPVEDRFVEDWDAERLIVHSRALRETVEAGGWVGAALREGRVCGFVSLDRWMNAQPVPTMEIHMMHVSAESRHQGVGTRLMHMAMAEARRRGAEAVYLSTHSAVESQAFYASCGCVEAAFPDPAMAAEEPCDVQLVRPLTEPLPLAVLFPDSVPDEAVRFAVILAHQGESWLLCRHRDRSTWEIPGGHREPGESAEACARRELWEETGATGFDLTPAFPYVVAAGERETCGMVYRAQVHARGSLPPLEIAECRPFDTLPDNWTYPQIQPRLWKHATSRA